NPEISKWLIPDYVDTNQLLAAVDLLITDYSSIFFDFLVTNKPILFYTWDLDVYSSQRGQYFANSELPGPLLFNAQELVAAIRDLKTVQETYQEKYETMKRNITNHEDGKVTERIIQYIFRDKGSASSSHPNLGQGTRPPVPLNIIKNLDAKKQKMLIYPGGMRNNGITASFINLSNNLDYDKYDVTCFLPTSNSAEVLNNIAKINKNVRLVFKGGLPAYLFFEQYKDKFIHNRGKNGKLGERLYPDEAFAREHKRLFGKTSFDYVVDFSGYSLYWAKLLLAADAKQKICYLHSDMKADSERLVDGRRQHRINLRGLFSVYDQFDRLVSVSEGAMEVNKQNLAEYAAEYKFDYVLNSINPSKILDADLTPSSSEEEIVNDYKARALLKNIQAVWNTLPLNEEARPFQLGADYNNAEIFITRRAVIDGKKYYKFSHQNRVIGWIEANGIEFLPDKIIAEVTIDKIGTIKAGSCIWSRPFKLPACEKVCSSADYKGVIVDVDKEVETGRGISYRITVNGTVIGWIEASGLTLNEAYTIHQGLSKVERASVDMKRKVLKARNFIENRELLQKREERPLGVVKIMNPVFVKVSKSGDYNIWNQVPANEDAIIVAPSAAFAGDTVTIRAGVKTRGGFYYLFYKNNQKIGWMNATAFESVKKYRLKREERAQEVPEPNPDELNFVHMGRLSPEKRSEERRVGKECRSRRWR